MVKKHGPQLPQPASDRLIYAAANICSDSVAFRIFGWCILMNSHSQLFLHLVVQQCSPRAIVPIAIHFRRIRPNSYLARLFYTPLITAASTVPLRLLRLRRSLRCTDLPQPLLLL